jgi:hypothetical protein
VLKKIKKLLKMKVAVIIFLIIPFILISDLFWLAVGAFFTYVYLHNYPIIENNYTLDNDIAEIINYNNLLINENNELKLTFQN